MKYCPSCGAELLAHSENPDNPGSFTYYECRSCGTTHQYRPKILVASFIRYGNKLLWMRRAHPPRQGCWALPAGFMELGETLQEAAARELFEETNVAIPPDRLQLYMIGSIGFINEVYIGFQAQADSEFCQVGAEALEVGFFSREELPWENIAFPDANVYIEQAYDDIAANQFPVYQAEITKDANHLLPLVQDLQGQIKQ